MARGRCAASAALGDLGVGIPVTVTLLVVTASAARRMWWVGPRAEAWDLAVVAGVNLAVVGPYRLALVVFTVDSVVGLFRSFARGLSAWPDRSSVASEGVVMAEVEPATIERFDDVAIMLGPKRPGASVCWCLSHRLDSKTNRELVGPARGEYVKSLCERDIAPGVLAYEGGEVVGWAAVAPRSELPFARSTKIPHIDELPVWSVWCIRVRPGRRGKGFSHRLLDGAVAYARANGAPAVEGYPVDNKGAKVDATMAYVGTRAVFERAGFTKAADTQSVSGGFPRVLMRLRLSHVGAPHEE